MIINISDEKHLLELVVHCVLVNCKLLFIMFVRKLKFKFYQKSLEIITSDTDS